MKSWLKQSLSQYQSSSSIATLSLDVEESDARRFIGMLLNVDPSPAHQILPALQSLFITVGGLLEWNEDEPPEVALLIRRFLEPRVAHPSTIPNIALIQHLSLTSDLFVGDMEWYEDHIPNVVDLGPCEW